MGKRSGYVCNANILAIDTCLTNRVVIVELIL